MYMLFISIFLLSAHLASTKDSCKENAKTCYKGLAEKSDFTELVQVLETKEDIEKFCRETGETLKCLELYKDCIEEKYMNLYGNATHSISQFHGHLCYEKRQAYIDDATCFYQNHDNMKNCENQNLVYKKLLKLDETGKCCVVENYHWCVMEPVLSKCGFLTTELLTELIDKYFSFYRNDCKADEDRMCEDMVGNRGNIASSYSALSLAALFLLNRG